MSPLGNNKAPNEEIIIVKIIVVALEEILVNLYKAKLAIKLIITNRATALSFLAGGIKIAKNIAYKATDKQLTILAGRTLPIIVPNKMPSAQHGEAKHIAP